MTLIHLFLKVQNEGNPDFLKSHSNLKHIINSVNEYARRWGKQEKKNILTRQNGQKVFYAC